MERSPVESSNIKSIGYDNDRQTLELEFNNGAVYQYFNVAEDIYQSIASSASIGAYFAKNIKGRYTHAALSNASFRELDFIRYLSKLMEANDDFSNIYLEPGFTDSENRTLRPDIVCEFKNKTLVIEAKNIASVTNKRVDDYIAQVKRYEFIGDDIQLVIAFPDELQVAYEDHFNKENILVWDASKLASIFSHQLEVIRESPLYPILFSAGTKRLEASRSKLFIENLNSIKPGKSDWNSYQKLIANIMEYLFTPPLGKPRYELADKTKTNRRDITIPNYAENGFWRLLREGNFADYIVIDAKNLTKLIEKRDVLQVSNYLKKFGTGLFGMIVSRNKPHQNAIHTQREHWIADNKLIIFLQDEDIIQMLTMKDGAGKPEEVIRQKIEDFRLSL
ncbi:MAG: KTSC domain-containing protein [Gammaproteobacteria bacterium]|nr:KTSC domain-containing protein [Gammaproteobacteria bacterium]MCK5092764.1 KTSC domain-containing protein [Gammaproteobacteria bacterium]